MPRGIYDRTKTKAQRTVEKVNKSASPKKKSLKKTAKEDFDLQAQGSLTKIASSIESSNTFYNDTWLMSEARSNLDVLNRVAEKFSDVSSVDAEILAHIEILGRLSKKVFAETSKPDTTVDETLVETDSETENSVSSVVPLPPVSFVAPGIMTR